MFGILANPPASEGFRGVPLAILYGLHTKRSWGRTHRARVGSSGKRGFLRLLLMMMNFDPPTTSTLPQALAGALRRLAQLAHTSSWDQWAVQRLTPTQRKILQILGS